MIIAMKKLWKLLLYILAFSIPLSLLFLAGFSHLVTVEKEQAMLRTSRRNEVHLRYIEDDLHKNYRSYLTEMNHLISFVDPEQIFAGNGSLETAVSRYMNEVLISNPQIHSIGITDSQGEKGIHISKESSEKPVFTPHSLPMSYLSAKAQDLSADQTYIEVLDIMSPSVTGENLEKHTVMVKPYFSGNDFLGPLYLCSLTIDTQDQFDRYDRIEPRTLSLSITDGDGYLIDTTLSEDSFLVQEQSGRLKVVDPVWTRVTGESGSFLFDGIFYTYLAFKPLEDSSKNIPGFDRFLYLLASDRVNNLPSVNSSFLLRHAKLKYLFTFLIFAISTGFGIVAVIRHLDRERLNLTNIVSENTPEGVLIKDRNGRVTFANKAASLITGYPLSRLTLNPPQILFQGDPSARSPHDKEPDRSELATDYDGLAWMKGNRFHLLIHLRTRGVYTSRRRVKSTVHLFSDTRNLSEESFNAYLHEDHTEARADLYPLSLIGRTLRREEGCILVYIKLTNLEVLEAMFTRGQHYQLDSSIRTKLLSLMEEDEQLFHYSPDTYMLLLSLSFRSLERRMEEFHMLYDRAVSTGGRTALLEYQCGISVCEKGERREPEPMLKEARMALSSLSHYRKTGWLRYNDEIEKKLTRYYAILRKIPGACSESKIETYYQPLYRVEDDVCFGGECLARWHDEELGWITPDEFIPLIETHGYDRLFDAYMLEHAIRFLSTLSLQQEDEFCLSVNICASDISHKELVPHICETLRRYGVDPSRLYLEITENTLLREKHQVNRVLDELRCQHIKVAIDDFGTGYSSLSYINQLNTDVIKIDREFIMNYPENDDGTLIQAIMKMARDLSIPFLVEGIETEEQLALIRTCRAYAYQGFLRSRPLPEAEFRALFGNFIRIVS